LDVRHHRRERLGAGDCILGGAFLDGVGIRCTREIDLEQVCELGVERGGVEYQVLAG